MEFCTVVGHIAQVQASFSVPGAWPSYNLAQDGRLEEEEVSAIKCTDTCSRRRTMY